MTLQVDRDVPGPRSYSYPVKAYDAEGNQHEELLRWDFDDQGWIPAHLVYRTRVSDHNYQVDRWEAVND